MAKVSERWKNMRAQLVPLDGGPAVEVAKEMTLIGRTEECDLRLDHKSVSKMHCVLVKTDGLLVLRDLGSTNGTRVNGARVRRAALLPNDKLSVANFHFRVLFGAALDMAAQTDQTQRIDPADLKKLQEEGDGPMADSAVDMPVLEVRRNALPDVYPDEKK
jgi:pSer/pThr/pTyr-binding forkhead associated (FHA) protein